MIVDQLSISQEIPDKLYYRIGEVAELAGVPSYVLRFWESEFPSISPKRTDTGQRLYRKSDVEIILTIKHLLHEKRFTIEGAKQYLHLDYHPDKVDPITEIDSREDESYEDDSHGETSILKEIYQELKQIRDLLR